MTVRNAYRHAAALTLTVAALLPMPLVSATAATADQGATSAHLEAGDPSGEALRLLAQPPFPPTDLSLLATQAYPAGPPMQPAPPRAITVSELVRQLNTTLKLRGRRAVEEGLAVFQSQQISAIVPDLNLRAALASLASSPAAGSIQTVREGLVRRVAFAALPNPSVIAQTFTAPHGQIDIFVNQRYRYEDFRLLGVTLSHETLHQDGTFNNNEEAISATLHTAYYGQLLLEQPQLATSRTELARRLNTGLMALLNTRDDLGRQRLTHATGNVLPGTVPPLPSFGAAYLGITPGGGTATDPTSTPGNANLDFYLNAITRTRHTGAAFNTATVQFLDHHQAWATPSQRIRLAHLLKLRLPSRPGKHIPQGPVKMHPSPATDGLAWRGSGSGT
ncbi:hypothetical protein [Streptomyces sp. NPDC004065]|uniref:hypothetical protein n=1 Tax=Streptomyces sp. NPDC004065 TaxID=3364689 RepID=UPI0038514BAB